jgi:hypothetical protein
MTLADKAMTQHSARAGDIAEALSAEERKRLGQLLRKLLLSMEGKTGRAKRPVTASVSRESVR